VLGHLRTKKKLEQGAQPNILLMSVEISSRCLAFFFLFGTGVWVRRTPGLALGRAF